MWSLRSLEHASVIQKLTILEHKNGLVLSNTRVPVSGTWSILFPYSSVEDFSKIIQKAFMDFKIEQQITMCVITFFFQRPEQ